METTNRALAFARRWFDEATVRSTFEPLIADWQREWQDAPRARTIRVSMRGLFAFVLAVIVSSPRIVLTAAPPEVTRQIAVWMVKFIAIATAVLMIPPVIEIGSLILNGSSWARPSLFFFAVPAAMTLAFPFAMTGAVDTLRRHHSMPAHVARAAVLKLGAFAFAVLLVDSGWVVPAANRAARIATNPAGMSEPLRMMRELTTYELVSDPARASVFDRGTYLASRSQSLKRELNQRAAIVALPIVLLWLRWRALGQPSKRWITPLPPAAAAIIAIAVVLAGGYGGAWLEREWQWWYGTSSWLPIAVLIAWGMVTRYCRPVLLARV